MVGCPCTNRYSQLTNTPPVCIVEDGGPACKSNRRVARNVLVTDHTVADLDMLNEASAGTGRMSLEAFFRYSETIGMNDRAVLATKFKE